MAVRVPEYQGGVALRPELRQDVEVKAKPEAFGWDVGHGLVGVAKGVENFSDAIVAVRDIEDVTRAKEADNALAAWHRERAYGQNGFMTLEGKAAVDSRAAFEREAEDKRRELGKGLSPRAARYYGDASNARMNAILQNSITHTAAQRKVWVNQASAARVETFANDALVNFDKPDVVNKNIAAAQAEMRQQAGLQGWDAATLKAKEEAVISGVHKNITLRLAQKDPLAADKYRKDNAGSLSGADQYALEGALKDRIQEESAKREADKILGSPRTVGEVAAAGTAPAAAPKPGRTLGEAGPTKVRAFLIGKAGGAADKVDGLDETFATNIGAMFQDAPANIREGLGVMSGFRSVERQRELYEASDKTGKWVARPGHSQHNHGRAVDISYNGRSLKHAPQEVLDWVHSNAGKYGLHFPMAHEPWHVEPVGSRDGAGTAVARSNNISPRAAQPSYADIEARLQAITDPAVRDLTRKRLYTAIEVQGKAIEQQEKLARAELWSYVDKGETPDQIPNEVKQAAGMAAVSAAWSYLETAAKGREVKSDETLLYSIRKYAAQKPDDFANVDLNDYRDRLSKEHIKELTGLQTTAMTDQRKAREEGLNLAQAFSQSETALEAAGVIQSGKQGKAASQREAKRVAAFNNALADEMAAFQKREGKPPSQMDIQSMRNKLLLPIVIGKPDEFSLFRLGPNISYHAPTENKFLFDARMRPDGSPVAFDIKYGDIPIDMRRGIAVDLERELGRKPSEKEVIARYQVIVLDR